MKRISLILTVLAATMLLPAHAQDVAALNERVQRLTGYIQDLQEKNVSQQKQIDALVKELASLRDHQSSQPTTASASAEDLRALAKQVQEIEDKRKSDRAFLEKEFDRLAKVASTKSAPIVRTPGDSSDLPKTAREHTIASGDTFSTIAAAYSKETGAKVTVDLIQKANPGVDPLKLKVGQTILVPIPQ